MDRWHYYDVIHQAHDLLNPLSRAKLQELIDLLDLPGGTRILDIGCGKGEFLLMACRDDLPGVGVDLSPPFVAEARSRAAQPGRPPVQIVEMDGKDYTPDPGPPISLAACFGASWIWGGYEGTLRALTQLAMPGGLVISGEPYWKQPPPREYLEVADFPAEQFHDHAGNVAAGEAFGLSVVHTVVSNDDEWDRYVGLHSLSLDRYRRAHPEDRDLDEITKQVKFHRDLYLRWERAVLGWAVYVFRTPTR